jgi:hypothetical protein
MADPILKEHGAIAKGTIWPEGGQWRASLLVSDPAKEIHQDHGPQDFPSGARARAWLVEQAALHGFGEGEFDIQVEEAV